MPCLNRTEWESYEFADREGIAEHCNKIKNKSMKGILKKGHTLHLDRCLCQLESLIWADFNWKCSHLCVCGSVCLSLTEDVEALTQQPTWIRTDERKSLIFCQLLFSPCHSPPRWIVCSFPWAHSIRRWNKGEEATIATHHRPCSYSLLTCLLKELRRPAGKDERLDYSQISKWAG